MDFDVDYNVQPHELVIFYGAIALLNILILILILLILIIIIINKN